MKRCTKQPNSSFSNDGHICARKHRKGHRKIIHWHDEGTNSRRERELSKSAINTQLSQNLLSPQFHKMRLATFAIKFKTDLFSRTEVKRMTVGKEKWFGWIRDASKCESLLIIITKLLTFLQSGSRSMKNNTHTHTHTHTKPHGCNVSRALFKGPLWFIIPLDLLL